MDLILKFHREVINHIEGVDIRPLTSGRPNTGRRCPQGRSGTTQVKSHFYQCIKGGLKVCCRCSKENDVTGRPMKIGQTAPILFPDIANFSQSLGGVKPACWVIDTKGMEGFHIREKMWNIAISPNDSPPIARNSHNASMFPVGHFVIEG